MERENLFSDFVPVPKAEWLAKVEADLKGKPLEALYWHLSDTLRIDPFAHPQDRSHLPDAPVQLNRQWWVGAATWQTDAWGQQLEEMRAGGVQSVRLVCTTAEHLAEAAAALAAHWPDVPHLVLDLPADGALNWRAEWVCAKQPDWVCGGVSDDVVLGVKRVLCVAEMSCEEVTASLYSALYAGAQALEQAVGKKEFLPAQVASHLAFRFWVGPSYFLEIARLRAFALLWGHLLEAWGVPACKPLIEVHFAQEAYGDDPYHNMIRATTLAMSAILGGADRLEVRPVQLPQKGHTPFTRRIARNVQHILMLESHFDKMADPVAGSWYVEQLADQLAQQVWTQFCQEYS